MKNQAKIKRQQKKKRQKRVRVKISGTAQCPRLSIFRSLKHLYVQLIDDQTGKTLASVKDSEVKVKGQKQEIALAVGKLLAEKAQKQNIKTIVFDRSGYKYHGRVKAVAEGARAGGLKF